MGKFQDELYNYVITYSQKRQLYSQPTFQAQKGEGSENNFSRSAGLVKTKAFPLTLFLVPSG